MKLLEVLYQAGMIDHAQDTMVPRDGKFPRRTMALLIPSRAEMLSGKRDEVDVDALCDRIRLQVSEKIGHDITWFQIETMLCIYRQSLRGKYPSGRHDSELGHWMTAMQQFAGTPAGDELYAQFPFHELRKELYPIHLLGEWNEPSWWGIRPELEAERKAEMHALGIA
jgi:hypothetical protein